jgi:hypothetical protein
MTRTPIPIGYFGILVPTALEYQGFFLYSEFDPAGQKIIDTHSGSTTKTGKTIHPTPGVAAQDQPLFGALSASVIEAYFNQQLEAVATLGAAIRLLGRHNYFLIHGERMAAGWITKFEPLAATTAAAARAEIEAHPAVMALKAETLTRALRHRANPGKSH